MLIVTKIIYVVLTAQSILGCGLFLFAVLSAIAARRQHIRPLQRLYQEMKTIRLREQRATRRKRLKASRLHDYLPLPVRETVLHLLSRNSCEAVVEIRLTEWTHMIQGRSIGLLKWLATTAPMVGLAGTVAGISQALGHFSARTESPELVIEGFGTAMNTTLIGLFIAFLSLLTVRLIWAPVMRQIDAAWEGCYCMLKEHFSYVRPASVRSAGPRRHAGTGQQTIAVNPAAPDEPQPSAPQPESRQNTVGYSSVDQLHHYGRNKNLT